MKNDNLFYDGYVVREPLSEKEFNEVFDRFKQGDEEAKTKLIEHNIRLVLYEVKERFSTVKYDKKDLVSIGIIGLIKALNAYDISKNVKFTTFAVKCIDNEILMFLRKLKKYKNDVSLGRPISYDLKGNEIKVEDTLSDDTDIVEEYITNDTHRTIRKIIKYLPEREREIIMFYYGFYNGKIYSQHEIADRFNISQSYVSRLIKRITKRLGEILQQEGVIELKSQEMSQSKDELPKEGEVEMGRNLQTIYQYFSSYTKEEIDDTLEKLSEEEKALITLRYGDDLNNPISKILTKEENEKFYGGVIPKMKRLLANASKKKGTRKSSIPAKETIASDSVKRKILVEQISEEKKCDQIIPTTCKSVSNQVVETNLQNKTSETISKEDYLKIMDLLRTPIFTKMMNTYSPKEVMIASLRLGYIDGKCFSSSAISEFLGIAHQEVVDVAKKVLLAYKEKINQLIDSAIQIVTAEQEIAQSNKLVNK